MKPDKPLTLEDIRKIQADYYEGTPYDMTKGPAAGPWGNPIRYVNRGGKGSFERSINVQRTYYLHIAQVNASLPEPLRGTSWFGYGAPATSYLTPHLGHHGRTSRAPRRAAIATAPSIASRASGRTSTCSRWPSCISTKPSSTSMPPGSRG